MTRASTSGPGESGCFATAKQPARRAAVTRFAELAKTDPSPKVRLSLASALQRLPLDRALGGRRAAGKPREDASDRIAPLDDLVWSRAAGAGRSSASGEPGQRTARSRPCAGIVARRAVAAEPAAGLAAVVSLLATADDAVCRRPLDRRPRRVARAASTSPGPRAGRTLSPAWWRGAT